MIAGLTAGEEGWELSDQIWELSDRDLVLVAVYMNKRADELKLPINAWEKAFIQSVGERFLLSPSITWKQRRILRKITTNVTDVLEHRAEFTRDLKEALK